MVGVTGQRQEGRGGERESRRGSGADREQIYASGAENGCGERSGYVTGSAQGSQVRDAAKVPASDLDFELVLSLVFCTLFLSCHFLVLD